MGPPPRPPLDVRRVAYKAEFMRQFLLSATRGRVHSVSDVAVSVLAASAAFDAIEEASAHHFGGSIQIVSLDPLKKTTKEDP